MLFLKMSFISFTPHCLNHFAPRMPRVRSFLHSVCWRGGGTLAAYSLAKALWGHSCIPTFVQLRAVHWLKCCSFWNQCEQQLQYRYRYDNSKSFVINWISYEWAKWIEKKKCSSVREFPYFFPASVYVPLGQDGLLGLQINASYDYIKHQS